MMVGTMKADASPLGNKLFAAGSPSSTAKLAIQVILIFAAAFLVFSPSLRGGWLWDDTQLIRDNVLVHDPGGWWKIWLEPGRLIDFQPITTTFFWLEWHSWGNSTLGYHVTNILLHGLGSVLVWLLLARLGLRAAWLGGLLFAIHPLVVESVSWMAEAKNVLSLPPFLLALLAWLKFSEKGGRQNYTRALGFFLVALLCKATVIMFPVLILLHAWWRRGRIDRRDLRAGAPFFLLSLLFGVITIGYLHQNALERPALPDLGSPFTRFVNAGLILGFYFGKALFPVGLLPVYPQWTMEITSPVPYLIWALLGIIFCALWARRRGWGRHALLGMGFFTINLAPFLGITAGSYMAFTWVMDHVLYLPLIGLIGLFTAAWGEAEWRLGGHFRSIFFALTAMIFIALGWSGYRYAHVFRSSEILWTYTLRHNPQCWLAHCNLAQVHEGEGRHDVALADYIDAMKLRPRDPTIHCDIGVVLDEMGNFYGALAQYDQALQIESRTATAYADRGVVLTQLGRPGEAIAEYEHALAIKPMYAEAHNNLGAALAESDRPVEAIEQYQMALEENPEYALAHANLGDALGETGHYTEALAQYREVLRLNPDDAGAHDNSGVALTRLGRISEAIEEYRTALRLDPRDEQARKNLSALLNR